MRFKGPLVLKSIFGKFGVRMENLGVKMYNFGVKKNPDGDHFQIPRLDYYVSSHFANCE